jgi:excisionase family DNA binding protein
MTDELRIKLKLALIRETGTTSITNLSYRWNINRSMIYHALAGEGVRTVRVKIAKTLGKKPSELWTNRSAEVMRQDDELYESGKISELIPPKPKVDKSSPWLTVEEAAKYLKLNEKTLRNYMSQGLIPHSKPLTGTVRFHKKVLDSWLLRASRGNRHHGIS